ncbi:ribose-5-phosphate isomerase [Candidatus Woesearchaeota archaeon CG10_big_fil_rev_8_21_14_0_10_32_24]|nr:MAG: ribose-5-phosphate isomerase [Candidatus Woesearchaeota archaeon CG10_big_fil_rev_8_21_14_0_10_32_24]
MKVFIASDHGGFNLKKELIEYLIKKGHNVRDLGPFAYNKEDDYPDFAIPLAESAVKEKAKGIVICRNGQGICIAVNKVKGARGVTGFSMKEAKTTRLDDDANILSLPAEYLEKGMAKKIVDVWLNTKFSGKIRHKRRLNKVRLYEQ